MEYASVVWDPYHINYSNMLKKIQRRAARWVTGCFDKYSSVTTILCSLGWPTLAQHQKYHDWAYFIKSYVIPVCYHYHHITWKLKDPLATTTPSTLFNHIPILQHINTASFHNPLKIGIVYLFHWSKSTTMTYFYLSYLTILITL